MKQKVLLSACALAACLGACTNDDYVLEQAANGNAGTTTTVGEVVGADLASRGMNIVLDGEGIATHAGNGYWENGDRFGLAWYNYQLNGAGNAAEDIKAVQDSTTWAGNWMVKAVDNNIYANHIFTYNNGSFSTQSDVYQGAYFVYYPYERQSSASGITNKVINVNAAEQTGNFAEERWNKALQLSAQDFIKAGVGVDENEQLTRNFLLSPAVNVLSVNATPDTKIVGETDAINFLKNLAVTELTVNAGGNASGNEVFATRATLQPIYIPNVTKEADNVTIDEEQTLEDLDAAAALSLQNVTNVDGMRSYLTDAAMSASVTTTVRNAYTIANVGTEGNGIRVFAFPIAKAVTYGQTDPTPSATVRVGVMENGKLKYELGEFEIESTGNKAFTDKLETALSDEDAAFYLGNIVRTAEGAWSFVNLDADLLLSHFTPLTDNIQSEDQWNDLVKIYDALVELEAIDADEVPVFTLGNNVTFKGETIATPKGIDIKLETVKGGNVYSMTFSNAEVTWPENLQTSGSSMVVVPEGTTLNVSMNGEEITINSVIENNGTINAGKLASLSQNNAQPITNNGRIVIEYGAYVYPNGGTEGVIAYEMTDADDEVARINALVSNSNNKGLANVNTLIIPEDLTLNLDAEVDGSSSGDRYNENVKPGATLADLSTVDIELEGGSVISTTDKKVNNVIAVKGESDITDVDVVGDITTKAGATLNVNTDNVSPNEFTFDLVNINNYGTLKANTYMTVEIVNNYKGGDITVADGYSIIYSVRGKDGYLQEGTAEGSIAELGAAETAEAKAVESTFTTFVNAWSEEGQDVSTAAKFVAAFTALTDFDSKTMAKAFFDALNAWRADYGYPAIADNTKLSETDLILFTDKTGIQLFDAAE